MQRESQLPASLRYLFRNNYGLLPLVTEFKMFTVGILNLLRNKAKF